MPAAAASWRVGDDMMNNCCFVSLDDDERATHYMLPTDTRTYEVAH